MSHVALTAKYRPQTFAQMAGQESIKAILSRAALERKVAPAYLFSGTRGVGKTTLARVFAKALNCRRAPAQEPCNQCDQCRAITLGSAVDVVEIDGASNRGIDDVRRLKEVVGYAPMEGAYKIFIIDEAHMLSREAFNALLKTLEEPPAGVTFIMATTEPHKFPATIVSRCQHYVFKPLSENALTEHLRNILAREGIEYEESALRLIARRGAGSARDAMSILGQVLALGDDKLFEDSARKLLGLVGQEGFMRMLAAFRDGDSLTVSVILQEMLAQGLDMGFFLRELASLWRNLFLLRQSGEAALSVVELPEQEAKNCLKAAQDFSLQHIHACWQMTLEGQRRVLDCLEPALALELLLLNIAMLPRLLSLEHLSALGRKSAPPAPAGINSGGGPVPQKAGAAGEEKGRMGKAGSSSFLAQEAAASAETGETFAQEDRLADENRDGLFPFRENASSAGEEKAFVTEGMDGFCWEAVRKACAEGETPSWLLPLLCRAQGQIRGEKLLLVAQDEFTAERLCDPETQGFIQSLIKTLYGAVPLLIIEKPNIVRKSREELKAELMQHPLIQEAQNYLGAFVIDFGQLH